MEFGKKRKKKNPKTIKAEILVELRLLESGFNSLCWKSLVLRQSLLKIGFGLVKNSIKFD